MAPHRVGFLRRFGLKAGIRFAYFGLESDIVFERVVQYTRTVTVRKELFKVCKCISVVGLGARLLWFMAYRTRNVTF